MRQTSSKKVSSRVPLVPIQPQDVHIAISDRLKAYSVFTPNGHIEVFDVVGILPHPSVRHESPDCTDVNLKQILEYRKHHPAASSVSSSSPFSLRPGLLDDLCNDLLGTEPPDEEPMSSFHVGEQVSTITMSSLVKMQAGVSIPLELGHLLTALNVGLNDTASLKLSAASIRKSRNCADLRLWLWKNCEAIFNFLFPYIEPSLNKYSDRDIMAIVTTKITATVSLKRSQNRQKGTSLSLVSWFSALCGRVSENDTDFNNLSGVTGIHFLLIPIKKIEDGRWKVYKPWPFVAQERTADSPLKNDILLQAIRWACTEEDTDVELTRRFGAPVEVSSDHGPGASQLSSQVDSKGAMNNALNQSNDLFEASDFVYISLRNSWASFLEKQCNAARFLLTCRPSDQKLALRMLQSAADKGYNPAIEAIAKCYRQGIGVTEDYNKAREWLAKRTCVEYGARRSEALTVLPRRNPGERQRFATLIRILERLVEEGRAMSLITALAKMLENEKDGVVPDLKRAAQLYEWAAEEGNDVRAMTNLGRLLEKGADGVKRDAARAKEWYERAVEERGDVDAMNNLAVMLQNGAEGVPSDPARARELYERAIRERSDVRAMHNLAVLLLDDASDPARASKLNERAIRGYVRAMNNSAVLLQKGAKGLLHNADRAKAVFKRLKLSIDRGDGRTLTNAEWNLLNDADCLMRDAARARELCERAMEEGGDVLEGNNLELLLELVSDAKGLARGEDVGSAAT
ncbi:Sel1-repeat containing protein [Gracilaria domingensis]|nr:Sel1-repeat containing protein [Gracilaria domingensis]